MTIARAGSEFLVNSTTENFQVTPMVAQLADGHIIFAFGSQDFAGNESGFCIRTAFFDSGVPEMPVTAQKAASGPASSPSIPPVPLSVPSLRRPSSHTTNTSRRGFFLRCVTEARGIAC